MTVDVAKQKLLSIIEKADEKKIMEMYSQFGEDGDDAEYDYDDETIKMLEQEAEDVFSGKVKAYSLEESLAELKKHRAQRGI